MLKRTYLLALAALALSVPGCLSGSGGDSSPDIWFVDALNVLRKIDLAATSQIDSAITITGLQVGETIEGLDFRPSTNQLFALGSTNRLYVIDPSTGVATQIGVGTFAIPVGSTFVGFDFNPVADRIRVVTDADLSMRLNPNDGTVVDGDGGTPGVQADTPLNPAGGDVTAAGYTNNTAAPATTTLYAIDALSDSLVRIGGVDGTPSPNGGLVTVIGPLGVNVSAEVSFDIDSNGNAILIATGAGPTNDVYTVNLATGAATLVGQVNGFNTTAMAVRP